MFSIHHYPLTLNFQKENRKIIKGKTYNKMKNLNTNSNVNIDYQFTAIPTNFIYLLDNDCYKLFSILVQKYTYWSNNNKLDNDYFIKSITELSEELGFKNRKDIRLTIEALYVNGIIDVITINQKRDTAKFKLNWEKIEELNKLSIYDIKEFGKSIKKLPRDSSITYCTNSTTNNDIVKVQIVPLNDENKVQNVPLNNTKEGTKCTTTIDNINNIDKKDNINNINKKEIYYNILDNNSIKENNSIINNIKKESEINEVVEVRSMVEKKKTVQEKVMICVSKLKECNSKSELEEKVTKLCDWFETKHDNSMSIDEFQNVVANALATQLKVIENKEKEQTSTVDDYNEHFSTVGKKLSEFKKVLTIVSSISEGIANQMKDYIAKEKEFIITNGGYLAQTMDFVLGRLEIITIKKD